MSGPVDLSTLRLQAEEILDELERSFPLGYRPRIVWKGLRVAAGYAYYREKAIGLSTRLITDEVRLRDTLLHEYAHLLAVARYGRAGAGHSPAWREAMRDLGLEPSVRHPYEVERNRARQRVVYRCGSCGQTFERVRRLPRGRAYFHSGCGGPIRFVQAVSAIADLESCEDVA